MKCSRMLFSTIPNTVLHAKIKMVPDAAFTRELQYSCNSGISPFFSFKSSQCLLHLSQTFPPKRIHFMLKLLSGVHPSVLKPLDKQLAECCAQSQNHKLTW